MFWQGHQLLFPECYTQADHWTTVFQSCWEIQLADIKCWLLLEIADNWCWFSCRWSLYKSTSSTRAGLNTIVVQQILKKPIILRPPAYTSTAVYISVRNPWKRHVSLCSSISKPYIQSNGMLLRRHWSMSSQEHTVRLYVWFLYARTKRNMSFSKVLNRDVNCCGGVCWWP